MNRSSPEQVKLSAFLHTPHFHVVPFALEHLGWMLLGAFVGAYLATGFIVGFAYSSDGTYFGADVKSWIKIGLIWPYAIYMEIKE